MKRLLIYLLFLVVAILCGLAIKADSGYVLIAYLKWTVEMPLWFAIIVIFIAFFIIHQFLDLITILEKSGDRWHQWWKYRKSQKANKITSKGILALIEGSFKKSEKLLIKSAKHSSIPILNYLGAAYATNKQEHYLKRDKYIYKALRIDPNQEIPIKLLQAQLQLQNNQLEQSLAILLHLQESHPTNSKLISLLQKLYVKLNDWQSQFQLLPKLKKKSILSATKFTAFAIEVHQHLLSQHVDSYDSLQNIWQKIPNDFKQQPQLIYSYAQQLLKFDKTEDAALLIEKYLKKNWDENLVSIYGLIKTPRPEKQLKIAEIWLKDHKDNVTLLITLGRLALAFKHWGKAKEYLLASLNIRKSIQAYAILAIAYEQLGLAEQAAKTYKHIAENIQQLSDKPSWKKDNDIT